MSNVYSQRFTQRLDALRAFAVEHGHTDVPIAHTAHTPAGDLDLGRWVAYVRARHRKGALAPERAAPLEALPGWTWEPRRPGPKPLADRNAEIRGLRADGASLDSIAETFGLSKQRVHQLVQRGR
jgi:hypothetical protein